MAMLSSSSGGAGPAPKLVVVHWGREHIVKRLGLRKRVLFGCATARQVWPLVTRAANRAAVETSERYADGRETRKAMLEAWKQIDWEPAMYVEWHIGTVSAGLTYRSP